MAIRSEADRIIETLARTGRPRLVPSLPSQPVALPVSRKLLKLQYPALATGDGRKSAAKALARQQAAAGAARAARNAEAAGASGPAAAALAAQARAGLAAAKLRAGFPVTLWRPEYVLLQTPIQIRADGDLALSDSGIVEGESFARFRVVATQRSWGRVRFFYFWTNESEHHVSVEVSAPVIVHGHNDAFAGGGWPFPQANRNISIVAVWAESYPVWDDSQDFSAIDIWYAFLASLLNDNPFDQPEVSNTVQTAPTLRIPPIVVPPNRSLLFATAVVTDANIDGDGQSVFDYETGDFMVGSPFAILAVTRLLDVSLPA